MADWVEATSGTFYNLDQVQIVVRLDQDQDRHKAGELEVVWGGEEGGCSYVPVADAEHFLAAIRARMRIVPVEDVVDALNYRERLQRLNSPAKPGPPPLNLSDHEFVEPCALRGYPVALRLEYTEKMRAVTLAHAQKLHAELEAVLAHVGGEEPHAPDVK